MLHVADSPNQLRRKELKLKIIKNTIAKSYSCRNPSSKAKTNLFPKSGVTTLLGCPVPSNTGTKMFFMERQLAEGS
jgi:hypothetical protein